MSHSALTAQWRVFGSGRDLQSPFNAAVVMPTIVRPEILRAVRSVYAQRGVGRIQLLIGVDRPIGALHELERLLEQAPDHVTPCLFYPGYSTSVRHGGLCPARDGGVLRCTLTHLANTAHIAYLDDDNWWVETHLSDLLAAIQGRDWAFALRWFVHPHTSRPVCIDSWESVGPGRGIFLERFGGFVDPNCLMIHKPSCWQGVVLWNMPLAGDTSGLTGDRNVFNFLRQHSAPGETGKATAYYTMGPADGLHELRLRHMGPQYAAAAQP